MLRIAKGLELPAEAVTQTFAILAKRGVGKTYTAKVMVEEMLKNNLPVVVLDPIGVWWGLRSAADGKGPGLSIIIAGGDHADIPITPDNGTVMANLVVDERLSVVIDLSHFRKGEQTQFVTDFAETLYHRNRTALHVVADEADAFAPQRPMPNEARMLGAMEDLVRRGRARGIGMTMITQRPSVLNKNVLTQIEVLVALRITAPLDQKAIDEWVRTHAEEGQRDKFMESLPSLPVGEAWFWSPGWLDIFQRVKVRKLQTLDSSSTPKVGEAVVNPGELAPVDLEAIRSKLAETIEKVQSEDPKVLRRQIDDLQSRLRAKTDEVNELLAEERQPEVRTVEVIPDEVKSYLKILRMDLENLSGHLDELERRMDRTDQGAAPALPASKPPVQQRPSPVLAQAAASNGDISKAERSILAVLAQYPQGRTVRQVAILTGYSHKGGGFRNALSSLRTKGYIDGRVDLVITEPGLEAIGDDYEPLPTGQALIEYWMKQLPLAPRKILEVAAFKYPRRVSIDKVADMTGYSAAGGGFRNALSKLRTLGLIEGHGDIKASDDFFKG